MKSGIFTIGHSKHSREKFLQLLKRHSITAVVDVRSAPYSRYNPQFNRETLVHNLKTDDIDYVFLGRILLPPDGQPKDREFRQGRFRRRMSALQ